MKNKRNQKIVMLSSYVFAIYHWSAPGVFGRDYLWLLILSFIWHLGKKEGLPKKKILFYFCEPIFMICKKIIVSQLTFFNVNFYGLMDIAEKTNRENFQFQ